MNWLAAPAADRATKALTVACLCSLLLLAAWNWGRSYGMERHDDTISALNRALAERDLAIAQAARCTEEVRQCHLLCTPCPGCEG